MLVSENMVLFWADDQIIAGKILSSRLAPIYTLAFKNKSIWGDIAPTFKPTSKFNIDSTLIASSENEPLL